MTEQKLCFSDLDMEDDSEVYRFTLQIFSSYFCVLKDKENREMLDIVKMSSYKYLSLALIFSSVDGILFCLVMYLYVVFPLKVSVNCLQN